MKTQLFTETTDVPATRSQAEITALLVRAGACAISTNFEGGKVESLSSYMLGQDGRSFFDTYRQKMLEAPKVGSAA